MDSDTLRGIFASAAEKYDVDVLKADFEPFRDMKLRWIRYGHTIELSVTDYLKEAPEDIVEGLAKTLLSKIYTGSEDMYPVSFTDWVTGDDFIASNRDRYLERCNVLSEDHVGRFHDLQGTYEGLVTKGLVDEIPGLSLRWTEDRRIEPLGLSSVLMRSVVIPTYMDTADVTDELFEFNLFRLLTNVDTNFDIDPMERKRLTDERIASYPDSQRLIKAIDDHKRFAECGAI